VTAVRLLGPVACALVMTACGCGRPSAPYTLDDAEERNRQAPDTFPIPPAEERANLRPGQIVKLIFAVDTGGEPQVERMWVVVTGRDGTGYVGTLDNQPVTTDRLTPGMTVRFEPRHVIAIHRKKAAE
jgi:hypothetical protein